MASGAALPRKDNVCSGDLSVDAPVEVPRLSYGAGGPAGEAPVAIGGALPTKNVGEPRNIMEGFTGETPRGVRYGLRSVLAEEDAEENNLRALLHAYEASACGAIRLLVDDVARGDSFCCFCCHSAAT